MSGFPEIPSDTPSSYSEPNDAPTIEAFDGVLVASTAHTLTFADAHVGAEIVNMDGASPIFFTVDGSLPAVDTSEEIPAIAGAQVRVMFDNTELAVVKLISAGTPTYSVVGIDEQEVQNQEHS